MEISTLFAYMVAVTLLVATPGQVVALVINVSLRAGTKEALITALGANGASLLLMAMAVLAISGVMALDPDMLFWLGAVGCLFIAHVAIGSLKDSFRHGKLVNGDEGFLEHREISGRNIEQFFKGFLVAIANPKDIVFFVAFFPQFIAVTSIFVNSIATLVVLWILIDLSVLGFYIVMARSRIARKYQRMVSFASSMLLLSVAMTGLLYALLAIVG